MKKTKVSTASKPPSDNSTGNVDLDEILEKARAEFAMGKSLSLEEMKRIFKVNRRTKPRA